MFLLKDNHPSFIGPGSGKGKGKGKGGKSGESWFGFGKGGKGKGKGGKSGLEKKRDNYLRLGFSR